MFLQGDEFIEIILPNQQQRMLLEERFQIKPSTDFITFSEWCKQSPLSSQLVANLIHLYLHPQKANKLCFKKIEIQDIIQYIKSSHDFYNSYYLFRFEQLIETSPSCTKESNTITSIKSEIKRFIKLFRSHIIWEESQPIPYIEFLNLQEQSAHYSMEECYALIAKNNLRAAANHDDEQHSILNDIIKKIQKFCNNNRFDMQWNYYGRLFQQFRQDLVIHEFIEDKILYTKALQVEKNLKALIDQRSVLN